MPSKAWNTVVEQLQQSDLSELHQDFEQCLYITGASAMQQSIDKRVAREFLTTLRAIGCIRQANEKSDIPTLEVFANHRETIEALGEFDDPIAAGLHFPPMSEAIAMREKARALLECNDSFEALPQEDHATAYPSYSEGYWLPSHMRDRFGTLDISALAAEAPEVDAQFSREWKALTA